MVFTTRNHAMDGMRALTHLSLIALHAAMLCTAHLPSEGPLWQAIKGHWVYTTAQAGGVQVDIMFMLAGFLLTQSLISSKKFLPNIFSFIFKRVSRMLPSMIIILTVGVYLGDSWEKKYRDLDNSPGMIPQIAIIVAFINNYFDMAKYGNFTGSLMWSCAADLHMSIVLYLIATLLQRTCFEKDKVGKGTINSDLFAKRLAGILFVLLGLSLAIRGIIFDPEVRNLVKLGQYSHFGVMMTDASYVWFQDYYNHTWHAVNTAHHISQEYMSSLYMPTHSRFGPYVVGGLYACLIHLTTKSNGSGCSTVYSVLLKSVHWVLTGIAIMTLTLPCIPQNPNEEIPLDAQFFMTVALRTMIACAAGYILYSVSVPSEHPFYSPLIASFLSLPFFRPIAELSFCSYLIHFRLLMEMILNPTVREFTGIWLPSVISSGTVSVSDLSTEWISYILLNSLLGAVISLALSYIMHHIVEKPVSARARDLFKSF